MVIKMLSKHHQEIKQGAKKEKNEETDARIIRVETNLKLGVEGAKVSKTIIDRMKELNIPGVSIAVINNEKIEWAKSYSLSSESLITENTLFQAGSTSKVVAATVALILASERKINLDQPVNEQLNAWKLPQNDKNQGLSPTLKQLLSHTAGINVHGFP